MLFKYLECGARSTNVLLIPLRLLHKLKNKPTNRPPKPPTLNDGENLSPELDYLGRVTHGTLYYHNQPLCLISFHCWQPSTFVQH